MSDLTPPPEEPLPDGARARIRAELLHTAQKRSGPSGRSPRWVVPGLAAAAVVLVAGSAAWAVRQGTGPDERAPVAGGTTTAASAAPQTPASSGPSSPSASLSLPPSVKGGELPGPPPAEPGQEIGTGSCRPDVRQLLGDASEAVRMPDADGTTSFWVAGGRFALCDVRAGVTTVHHPLALDGGTGIEAYRVSSVFAPTAGGLRTIRVAGGPVPAGADGFRVAYTFPDGHTETSMTTTDDSGRGWWRMVYEYDDGGGNELRKPPIEVTVTSSAGTQHYTLEWAIDTCAQANHGC